MLKKQLKNKKGWVVGPLVTAYSILALVLVFIIFGMLFRLGITERKAEIISATTGTGIDKMFTAYLRMPFTLEDGAIITTAELYSRAYIGYGSTKEEKELYKEDYKQQAKIELLRISKEIDPSGKIDQDLGYAMFYLPHYNYDNKFITVTPMFIPE